MITLLHGDAREQLQTLPDQSVQMVCTSPPYYGLRSYSSDPREIGKEATPATYVAALVAVFAEVWRVLRDDGTLWVNLGDSFGMNKQLLMIPARVALALQSDGWILRSDCIWAKPNPMPESVTDRPTRAHEYVFLFAKQARYFYDAAAISEPAVRAGDVQVFGGRKALENEIPDDDPRSRGGSETWGRTHHQGSTRNRRTVWHIPTQSYPGSHFATMPEALIEPCILAGSSAQACETCGAAWGRSVEVERLGLDELPHDHPEYRPNNKPCNTGNADRNDSEDMRRVPFSRTTGFAPRCTCAANTGSAASVVLDPFGGSGTVAKVAEQFQRNAILIDLNAAYIELQEQRTDGVQRELFV